MVSGVCADLRLSAGKASIWRLEVIRGGAAGAVREFETELGEEEFLGFVWRSVAAEDQGASIGSREMDVEHLHGAKLLEDRARSEPRGFEPQLVAQSSVETKGHESNEDMGFDAVLVTVEIGRRERSPLRFLKASSICVSNM